MELIGDNEYIRITSHVNNINMEALCYSLTCVPPTFVPNPQYLRMCLYLELRPLEG